MPHLFPCAVIFLSACFAGCTNLAKTIEKRVSVAETCRQAMEAPLPEGAVPNVHLASIRMGDVGSCQLSSNNGIVALCAYDQIWRKYQGASATRAVEGNSEELKAVGSATLLFEMNFKALRDELRILANSKKVYKPEEFAKLPQPARLAALQSTVEQARQKMDAINLRLDSLRTSLTTLRVALTNAGGILGDQAVIELAAWDSNVRIQLDQLEQVLAANVSLIISETLKDQVVRHVAKRSLDLVHGALKPAQAVIDKLDDRAYGAVSVGYLVFQPNLQDAVDSTYDNVKAVYNIRLSKASHEEYSVKEKERYVTTFLDEMQRTACENLIEGSKNSMLTELVDTMLVNKVQASKPLASHSPADDVLAGRTEFSATVLTPVSFTLADDVSIPAQGSVTPARTPLSVYVSNEWAARQQLLIQAISAQRKAAGNDAVKQFPGISTVDEADVRRLADAATARVIDDASRANPALLDSQVGVFTLSSALSSNVEIVTAASAVSQANAMLTANLSNSNVNTFTPTNNNAPVFNLPAYPASTGSGQTPQPPSLCSGGNFSDTGATCMHQGEDYIIVFGNGVGYAGDTCQGDSARDRLANVAGIVRSYGDRHGVRFETSVAGYASLTPAALKKCDGARQPRHIVCTYRNMAREEIAVQGCTTPNGDKNLLLSAARAKYAAAMLEQASGGSLLVRSLAARGAQARDDIHAYNPAAEQTVVLRFRPAK